MNSEPKIILTKRSYVKVYVEGQRCRFYNGKQLGIRCNPNKSKSLEEKKRALATLQYTLKKKLESGWKPGQESALKQEKTASATDCIRQVLRDAEKEQLSILYKRDLQKV